MIDLRDLSVDKNSILEIENSILQFDELEVLSANMNNVEHLNFLLGDPRKPPWWVLTKTIAKGLLRVAGKHTDF